MYHGTLPEKSGAAETMAIAMCIGLHTTYMFVPPTPGHLAVSGILNADLGQVILFGTLVSIPVMLVGYFGAQNETCRQHIRKKHDRTE